MNDPHESEKYLVRWARAKVEELEQRCDAFLTDQSTYAVVVERDPEAKKQIHKIVLQKPLPWELRGIASDTVKNLRDALDQACLHSTQRINAFLNRARRGKRTHFPFGENPMDFDKVLAGESGRQSKDIAAELHPILRSFQPYPRGEGYSGGNDRLRHIGRVSGPNKHDLTLTIGLNGDAFHFGSNSNPTGHGYAIYAPFWDSSKNEALIAEAHVDSYLDLDLAFASYIAFDHELIGRCPVHLVLEQWTQIVDDIVTQLIGETDRIVSGN